MSRADAQNNSAGRWLGSVGLALALYVLSSGPVAGLYANHIIPRTSLPFLKSFYRPLDWLHDYEKPGLIMERYHWWWARLFYQRGKGQTMLTYGSAIGGGVQFYWWLSRPDAPQRKYPPHRSYLKPRRPSHPTP